MSRTSFRTEPRRWFRPRLAAVLLAAVLSACAVVPEAPMEPLVLPAGWKHAAPAPGWASAEQARHWDAGQWWKLLDDPVLDELMPRVDLANQNLKLAAANVAQAQAMLREQQAQRWPQVGAQLGEQRGGGEGRSSSRSASFNINASWSPDLWGRLVAAESAQEIGLQASKADLAGARLDAQSSLVMAYLALRATDTEIELMDAIITGYERAAQITQNRYDVGVAPRTDTLQAQSTLASAEASRVALRRSRATYEHAVALLLGEVPATFSLPVAPAWRHTVPEVPTELPSLLLLRRPDVASAERAVAAANMRVGMARSAWFPDFSLSAGVGAGAAHLADLLSAPSLLWSFGLALSHTVFDAGARDARLQQALATHDAAVARYRQASLVAMKEVEDQLITLATLKVQIEHARTGTEAAARIEQQMINRYQAGLSAYTEVVTAQASAMGARRNLLQLQLQRQQVAVSLVAALGGGWQVPWIQTESAKID